jgi:hypothetical protein
MKKFSIFILFALLVLGFSAQVRAEMSPSSATGTSYLDNQVLTVAYNNSGSDITSKSIVILDTSATAGSTLGAYITTTSTADSKMVIGVIEDPTCTAGTSCRVAIRGPHAVWFTRTGAASLAEGDLVSTSTTAGRATEYSTSDGTAGGILGRALKASSTDGDIWWVWLEPKIHK